MQFYQVRRREFITLSRRRGSSLAARGARAGGEKDAAYRGADGPRRQRPGGAKTGCGFQRSLEELGWSSSRNIEIEFRCRHLQRCF